MGSFKRLLYQNTHTHKLRKNNLKIMSDSQTTITSPSESTIPRIYTQDEFLTFVQSSKMSVILFMAHWCNASNEIIPLFKTITEVCPEIKIAVLDVEYDDEDIAQLLQIKVVPTFMTFLNGMKIGECQGASQEGLNSLLADLQRKAGIRRNRNRSNSRSRGDSLPGINKSSKSVTSSSSSSRTSSQGSTFASRQSRTKKLPIKNSRPAFR